MSILKGRILTPLLLVSLGVLGVRLLLIDKDKDNKDKGKKGKGEKGKKRRKGKKQRNMTLTEMSEAKSLYESHVKHVDLPGYPEEFKEECQFCQDDYWQFMAQFYTMGSSKGRGVIQ